ncbi:hypothetical protein [Bosea minatitlanensis]|uniref:Uncharacterized protein n=1 Tax=Bosea minatitlanensis TaxID=128782 RepID=A0ABW0F3B7_9HYPH|nr:hypothetical protein [Bosea minatitlanensis]MCT4493003.1 hypothetical protein [Bosea minatitlanensis]
MATAFRGIAHPHHKGIMLLCLAVVCKVRFQRRPMPTDDLATLDLRTRNEPSAQPCLERARVDRGWMEQRGKIYMLIPAKVEAAR